MTSHAIYLSNYLTEHVWQMQIEENGHPCMFSLSLSLSLSPPTDLSACLPVCSCPPLSTGAFILTPANAWHATAKVKESSELQEIKTRSLGKRRQPTQLMPISCHCSLRLAVEPGYESAFGCDECVTRGRRRRKRLVYKNDQSLTGRSATDDGAVCSLANPMVVVGPSTHHRSKASIIYYSISKYMLVPWWPWLASDEIELSRGNHQSRRRLYYHQTF